MIIRNDASSHISLVLLDRRPMTGDRSGLNASVNQILYCFSLFTGRKAYIHIKEGGFVNY